MPNLSEYSYRLYNAYSITLRLPVRQCLLSTIASCRMFILLLYSNLLYDVFFVIVQLLVVQCLFCYGQVTILNYSYRFYVDFSV